MSQGFHRKCARAQTDKADYPSDGRGTAASVLISEWCCCPGFGRKPAQRKTEYQLSAEEGKGRYQIMAVSNHNPASELFDFYCFRRDFFFFHFT